MSRYDLPGVAVRPKNPQLLILVIKSTIYL